MNLLPYALPVVVAVLTFIIAQLPKTQQDYVHTRLATLSALAATVVASIEQTSNGIDGATKKTLATEALLALAKGLGMGNVQAELVTHILEAAVSQLPPVVKHG